MNRIRTALVLAVMASLALAGIASAHTPKATLTCEDGLTVVLLKYNPQGRNQVRITVDGEVIVEQDFVQEYGLTYQEFDPYISHTAFVQVYAWDDPTGHKGYSKEFTLRIEPCKTATPTPTATPSAPTPSPTATPSQPTPTRTPSTGHTPAPTLPPTDTAESPPTDSALPLFGVLLLVVVFVTTFAVTGKRR